MTLNGTTGGNGTSVVTYRLKRQDPAGLYTVQAGATVPGGQQALASAGLTTHQS